jgi:trehalose-6-phosphate synthase
MRITLRLILSLAIVVSCVAGFFAQLQVRQERERQRDELDRRAHLLAESLSEALEPLLARGSRERLQKLVEKFGNRERLAGVGVYGKDGAVLAITPTLPPDLFRASSPLEDASRRGAEAGDLGVYDGKARHLYLLSLPGPAPGGFLLIVHDTTFVQHRLRALWRENFLRGLVQTLLIALVTLLVVRWTIVNPVSQMTDWMKRLRAGETREIPSFSREDLFGPLAREMTRFARHLNAARSAAEEEARLRQTAETLWTPDRLKEHVRTRLQGRSLYVVSNREPYMHVRRGRKTEVIVPAGGLVTALDPVLRSCGGTWVAHGAGDADFEAADAQNRLKVPPHDPLYTLKRVPLSKEEENGYYYGFSNEGMWPLCHIAHTRPVFRPEDWAQYQAVNQKFADSVLEELEGVEEPCVLAQDYHFALLPRLIKRKRPDARVALFWHIPWPNPEGFGICPWQRDLLAGMIGADLIGFHTQYHCNNFLDTVDRALESRIDWERFAVNKEGHVTLVKPFPISVSFPEARPGAAPHDRAALLKDLGVKAARHLAVGVERMDYTKGVLERFRAVERFLEKHPKYQGEFVLVQLGAPSRTHIKRYHDFLAEVEAEAERINWRFKARDYRPIVFVKKHHSHEEIEPYYKLADICLVTSLHDGMNLVAKEFVAARDDGGGALILSRFTGAARELRDALIVNPYDVEQSAEALRYALEMDEDERRSRMAHMRQTVREHNIYRWAGNLIEELTRVRLDPSPPVRA